MLKTLNRIIHRTSTGKHNAQPICIHHVGGRGGGQPLPWIGIFGAELATIFYDADIDAANPNTMQGRQIALPYALGAVHQRRPFYINLERHTSSLIPPKEQGERFESSMGVDFDYNHCFSVSEERVVEVFPLDELWNLKSEMRSIPRPDVLSLDTQGSEYEILKGAKECLSHHTVAVLCEVEFSELYFEQKLFHDVRQQLLQHDFHFTRFLGGSKPMTYRSPIGMRGMETQIWSNALFLRAPETLQGDGLRLRKLVFIALLTGHLDFAWKALQLSPKGNFVISPFVDQFLSDIEKALAEMPVVYPPQFHMLMSQDKLDLLYETCLSKWVNIFDYNSYLQSYNQKILAPQLEQLVSENDSPIEAVLKTYGLLDIAETVSFNRRDQASKLQDVLKSKGYFSSNNHNI